MPSLPIAFRSALAAGALALLTVPGSALAETARPADSFVDSVGVNVHMSYNDTPYGDQARVADRLAELGVRHVRDGVVPGRPDQWAALEALGRRGIRSTLIAGRPDIDLPRLTATLRDQLSGSVEAVEGTNEYDASGDPNWPSDLRAFQSRLYAAVKGDPALRHLPVVGPSFIYADSRARLGDVSASLDYGNMHSYPGGWAPESNVASELALAASNSAAKPVQATETGYHNATASSSGHLPASEDAAGTYVPRLFLEYFRQGVARTFSYELIDEFHDPEATNSEARFGLLHRDFSPKPSFESLRRLNALLADPGPSFDPGRLDYRLEGQTAGTRSLLLRKRDGRFYLVIWQNATVWDAGARVPMPVRERAVTVNFADPIGMARTFRPVLSADVQGTTERVRRLPVDVTADPKVIELTPGRQASDESERVAPVITAARLAPTDVFKIRPGRSMRPLQLLFDLSEDARVRVTVERRLAGRRVRGTCRAASAQNRRGRRCGIRAVVSDELVKRGSRGSNLLRFRGRAAGRPLAAGSYRLALTAIDPVGNVSTARRVPFEVKAG